MTTLLSALRFFTRLPLPPELDGAEAPRLEAMAFAVPLVGLVVGGAGGLVLLLAENLWTPFVAALLALATMAAITGALHEDGLSDTCDGLFGGHTREKRLAIMRDSRIGAFGALALIILLPLKASLLAQLADSEGASPLAALLASASLSRGLMLVPFALLPAARTDGLAHGVGMISLGALAQALVVGAVVALAALTMASPARLALAALAGLAAALLITRLARAKIGGVTGDVGGTAQQLSELAILAVLAAGA